MNIEAFAVVKATSYIGGEINTPPRVIVWILPTLYAAEAAAKSLFAQTIAECKNNIEYAKYDSGDERVWYVTQDLVVHTIAVRPADLSMVMENGEEAK
jgi:hypothetical protein